MKFSQAKAGRVFVIRLEDGEIVHEVLERFAREEGIRAAHVMVVGGVDRGSRLVVGPREGRAAKIEPMAHTLEDVCEAAGTGTIFPDEDGNPMLHLHMACGRQDKTVTGCSRAGVKVWQILEAVITELVGCNAVRRLEPSLGFKLLQP
ncbi:MAG: DNA-binding protein [Verrucomicrobiae bacterium]|nr:DNA-binding protein [Verrucomicrobiae bacterium]